MILILAAAAIAAATPAPPPVARPPASAVNADPAIFAVHDADTTVYIFGTFHALDSKTEWFNDQVKDAFERSDELVLETLIPEGPPKPATALGAPPVPLRLPVATSASFLATTRMAIKAGRAQGMQVANGADMVLRRTAEREGKPVEGLESLQFQLDMFSRLPQPAAASPPRPGEAVASDAPMTSLSNSMAEMQSAWKRGDQSVFVRMLGQIERSSPETYRMMFVDRNARFAEWIASRMQQPGIVFVAVGAGHLAGRDSVLVRLAERGIVSQRVN
ncbi:MAG: TraB/GumN family protein [Sphingomicrobium sp.]